MANEQLYVVSPLEPGSRTAETVRLPIAEAAARLGVSEWFIRRRILSGVLRVEEQDGQLWVLLPADLLPAHPSSVAPWPTPMQLPIAAEAARPDIPGRIDAPAALDGVPVSWPELSRLLGEIRQQFERQLSEKDQTIAALRLRLAEAERRRLPRA